MDQRLARLSSAIALATLAATPLSHAAQRTFVSTYGNNGNPCSFAAPCREFSIALGHTDPGGEIVVLDSGGYGPVIIGQSVSITSPPGVYAGITVFNGIGIDVTAPGARVTLRGLTINGQGGSIGISFAAGSSLRVERCTISGMSSIGLRAGAANSTLIVADTVITDSADRGVYLFSGNITASFERVRVDRTSGSPGYGIHLSGGINASIAQSAIVGNVGHGVFTADGATAGGSLAVTDSVVTNNGEAGLFLLANQAHTQRVSVSDSVIARNAQGGIVTLAANAGSVAITDIARTTVSWNTGDGVYFGSQAGAGTRGALTASTIADNSADGVYVIGTGTIAVVGSSTLLRNLGRGFVQASGTFRSRGDNTIEASGNGATVGTISAASGPY
jgi:hypothetical protein